MNLDNVLQDPSRSASLVDHDWWLEGLVKDGEPNFDAGPHYKDNNIKDDLEIQWGHGTIEPVYSNEEHVPEPSGAVDRNLPPSAMADAGPVIMFARDLMNRGFMGRDLQRQLKANFEAGTLKVAASGLRELFSQEGIIGCIAVDTRGYEDPKQAIAAINANPNKRFIKYVIAEERPSEDLLWLPDTREAGMKVADSTGNGIDDFFGGAGAETDVSLVAHCPQVMMPIYAGDIDPTEMDDTFVDLMNVTGLPQQNMDDIINNDKYASRVAKLQAAFRYLDRSKHVVDAGRYADRVDASEFMIDHRDQEIDIVADTTRPQLSMGLTDPATELDSLIAMGSQDDIKVAELDAPMEIDLDPQFEAQAALDINPHHGDVEISLIDEIVAQDVSIAQDEDPNFIGCEFELDVKPTRRDMNVEMGSSIEW